MQPFNAMADYVCNFFQTSVTTILYIQNKVDLLCKKITAWTRLYFICFILLTTCWITFTHFLTYLLIFLLTLISILFLLDLSSCSSEDQIHKESGLCFGLYDSTSVIPFTTKDMKDCTVTYCESVGGVAFVNTASKKEFLENSTIFDGTR